MKLFLNWLVIAVMAVAFAGCAQTESKPASTAASKNVPSSSGFDETGVVSMHAGQPCTPQIMFDFRSASSWKIVSLAAKMGDSKVLTQAAKRGSRVRVSGTWQHGKDKSCSYVNVARVSLPK